MRLSAIILIFILSLYSCSEDDPGPITPAAVSETMEVGEWMIVGYFDDNVNETDKFNGYTFNFNFNGNLTVTTPDTSHNGSWIAQSDPDDTDYPTEFQIVFSTGNASLDEISDDWDVASLKDDRIELGDELDDLLPDNDDVLVFQKIQ